MTRIHGNCKADDAAKESPAANDDKLGGAALAGAELKDVRQPGGAAKNCSDGNSIGFEHESADGLHSIAWSGGKLNGLSDFSISNPKDGSAVSVRTSPDGSSYGTMVGFVFTAGTGEEKSLSRSEVEAVATGQTVTTKDGWTIVRPDKPGWEGERIVIAPGASATAIVDDKLRPLELRIQDHLDTPVTLGRSAAAIFKELYQQAYFDQKLATDPRVLDEVLQKLGKQAGPEVFLKSMATTIYKLRTAPLELNELAERIDKEAGNRHSEFGNWKVVRENGKVLGFNHDDIKIRLNRDENNSVTVQGGPLTAHSDLMRTVTVPDSRD